MSANSLFLDKRDMRMNRATPERKAALRAKAEAISAQLPGRHILSLSRFDPFTGNPTVMVSDTDYIGIDNARNRAQAHLKSIAPAIGYAKTQPVEYRIDPSVQTASSGAAAVYMIQLYQGIPIFSAELTVRFSPDGRVIETSGTTVSIEQSYAAQPAISAAEAVLKGGQFLQAAFKNREQEHDAFGQAIPVPSLNLDGFTPQVVATEAGAEQITHFAPGPYGTHIRASLIWFLASPEHLALCWEVIAMMPGEQGIFRLFIDASSGEILFCRQTVQHLRVQANVYFGDPGAGRKMMPMPMPLSAYDLVIPDDLPSNFPYPWVDRLQSVGLSTYAFLKETGAPAAGKMVNDLLTFDPGDPNGDEQKVLNLFYYACYMHDFFYLLGFREDDGNFQEINFSGRGIATDRLVATVYTTPVQGTANMTTPLDGQRPEMKMGPVQTSGRHTAFDPTVIFHEFSHGVTNRLVGGPMNFRALEAPQSIALGEGWGDYFACSITQTPYMAAWVTNRPQGIRSYAYNSDFPDHFGKVGQGHYTEEHAVGEIWCAALMEMNRNIGHRIGFQIVVDALKLSRPNPSFIDMRDAILLGLKNRFEAGLLGFSDYSSAYNGVWKAFSKFGMGPTASSQGNTLQNCVADFNMPPPLQQPVRRATVVEPAPFHPSPENLPITTTELDFSVAPSLAIPDYSSIGVVSSIYVPAGGNISHMAVTVRVEHPNSGDLEISLIAPDGGIAYLHRQENEGTANLSVIYRTSAVPAMRKFIGVPARGNWRLRVADLVGGDSGTLKSWSIKVGLANLPAGPTSVATSAQNRIIKENASSVKIPDDQPSGVFSGVAIDQSGTVGEVQVEVQVTHPYVGELTLALQAPSGRKVILQDRSGHFGSYIVASYTEQNTPALASMKGESINGQWKLWVSDNVYTQTGVLNAWKLSLVPKL